MEEVVALGGDRLLEVGARHLDREQGQVVVGVDLDVQLGAARQLGVWSRLRQGAAQLAQRQRLADDLVVALGRVDPPLVAVVELGVEERRRLPPPRRPGGGVVGDRGRDPAEQEAGLVRAQLDVGPLAVGMGGGRLAEHPRQALFPCPIHQEALGPREEVLAARGRQRHRLAGVRDRVAGRRQAHPHVAEQLAAGRLGDAGDVPAVGQPGRYLRRVVNPADVIRGPVSCFDRLGEDATLVRPEESEVHIHLFPIATTPA